MVGGSQAGCAPRRGRGRNRTPAFHRYDPAGVSSRRGSGLCASGCALISADELVRATALLEGRFPLSALWLFGSEARGQARRDSDVDLAILFPRPILADQLLVARLDLEALLGRSVDLIDLRRASPILGRQVLRDGRLLLDRDPADRHVFAMLLPSRYTDLKIARGAVEKALVEAVHDRR